MRIAFPRYDSSFGKLAGRYLNGDFGPLEAVDPHLSAILYAGDRFEAKGEIESALAVGKIVLTDRYIGSNLAHQTERVPPDERDEFLAWLKHVEYGIYGLPVEDLVVYLRIPAPEAFRLIGLKAPRTYTSHRHDIQEADVTHLGAHRLYQPGFRHTVFARGNSSGSVECRGITRSCAGAGEAVSRRRDS